MNGHQDIQVVLHERARKDIEDIPQTTLTLLIDLRNKWMKGGLYSTITRADLVTINVSILNLELMIQNQAKN